MRVNFFRFSTTAMVFSVVLAAACGGDSSSANSSGRAAGRAKAPVKSTSVRPSGATAQTAAPDRTGAQRVLFLGTSLTAGFGLDDPGHDAYPAVIQRIADSVGVKADVVNAGLSGETSAGALRRADWLLKQKPSVVVIEAGANDGLRGLNPDSTAANLRQLVIRIRSDDAGVKILLVQMEAPTNLGPEYTRAFHSIYAKVAASEKIPLSPFLLDAVAGVARLNQGDGIHPTPEGARIAARNLWPSLSQLLPREKKAEPTPKKN